MLLKDKRTDKRTDRPYPRSLYEAWQSFRAHCWLAGDYFVPLPLNFKFNSVARGLPPIASYINAVICQYLQYFFGLAAFISEDADAVNSIAQCIVMKL
jgi:hypothetical protein